VLFGVKPGRTTSGVVSAVLFGVKPGSPINDPIRLSLSKSRGGFNLVITGSSGQRYAVERSGDFVNWTPITTGQLSGTTGTVSLPWSAEAGLSCFRVKGQ
jgi:hypothetical protein